MFNPFDSLNGEPTTEPITDPEMSSIPRGELDNTGMNYEGVTSNDSLGTGREFRGDLGTGRTLDDGLGTGRTLDDGLGTGRELDDGLGTGTDAFGTSGTNEFDPSTYEL